MSGSHEDYGLMGAPLVTEPIGSFADDSLVKSESSAFDTAEFMSSVSRLGRTVRNAMATGGVPDPLATAGAFPEPGETGLDRSVSEGAIRPPVVSIGAPLANEEPVAADVLESRYGIPGRLKFDYALPDSVGQSMYQNKIAEIKREAARERRPAGLMAGIGTFGAQIIADALDPLFIGSMLVPGVPEMDLGASLTARLGARVLSGAASGVAQVAPLSVANYAMSHAEQGDYDAYQMLGDIAIGAGIGTALHVGGGALGDWLTNRVMRSEAGRIIEESPEQRIARLRLAASQLAQDNPVDVSVTFPGDAMNAYVTRSNEAEVMRAQGAALQREAAALRAEAEAVPNVMERAEAPELRLNELSKEEKQTLKYPSDTRIFHIVDSTGSRIGSTLVEYDADTKVVHLGYIGLHQETGPVRPTEILQLRKQMTDLFPDAEKLTAVRVKDGVPDRKVEIDLRKPEATIPRGAGPNSVREYVTDYINGKGRDNPHYEQFAANNAEAIEAEFRRRYTEEGRTPGSPGLYRTEAPETLVRPPQPDEATRVRQEAILDELTDPERPPGSRRRAELLHEYQMLHEGEAPGSELEQARSEAQRRGLLAAADRVEARIEELRQRAIELHETAYADAEQVARESGVHPEDIRARTQNATEMELEREYRQATGQGEQPVEFTTSRGSTYEVHEDGTTTRNKSDHTAAGHDAADVGLKTRSARTIYVDAKDAPLLSAAGLQGLDEHGARLILRDGKASLITWNKAADRWGVEPSARDIPFTERPEIGKSPVEGWRPSNDIPGYEAYRGQHAGNEITEVRNAPSKATTAPAMGQRELGGQQPGTAAPGAPGLPQGGGPRGRGPEPSAPGTAIPGTSTDAAARSVALDAAFRAASGERPANPIEFAANAAVKETPKDALRRAEAEVADHSEFFNRAQSENPFGGLTKEVMDELEGINKLDQEAKDVSNGLMQTAACIARGLAGGV